MIIYRLCAAIFAVVMSAAGRKSPKDTVEETPKLTLSRTIWEEAKMSARLICRVNEHIRF